MDTQPIKASLTFLAKDPLYETEKPYRISYKSENVPSSNHVKEQIDNIPIYDLRIFEDKLCFEENGISVLDVDISMAYDDFSDVRKIQEQYCHEMGQVLLEYLGATEVHVFDFIVRRRHPDFPAPEAYPADAEDQRQQPTVNIHIDSTGESILGLVEELNTSDFEKRLRKRIVYVNAWRPLKGPVRDWPLALCDATTVVPSRDFRAGDHVARNATTQKGEFVESYSVHHHPSQRWFYLRDQQPTEVLVFRQYDSNGSPGVPHGSFDISATHPTGALVPRESIEIRALAYF